MNNTIKYFGIFVAVKVGGVDHQSQWCKASIYVAQAFEYNRIICVDLSQAAVNIKPSVEQGGGNHSKWSAVGNGLLQG